MKHASDPKTGKPLPPKLGTIPSGFCLSGNHSRCRGGVWNGNGQVLVCPCAECDHVNQPIRCLDCNRVDDGFDVQVNTLTWDCYDSTECAAYREHQASLNPTIIQIRRIRAEIARAKEQGTDTIGGPVVRKRTVRSEAEGGRPTSGKCLCCGDATKGGLFLPGHDARLVARLAQGVFGGTMAVDDARSTLGPCSQALKDKFEKKLVRGAAANA